MKSCPSQALLACTAREIRGLRRPCLPVVNPRSHHATSPRTMRANVTHLTHGPTTRSHPMCVVRDAWTLRTTHIERVETLAPPPLSMVGINRPLFDLAGDAVPVSIQFFAVSRVAPIQGSCSRLLCLLAVGKVHALLPRLRHGRGSRRATAGLSLLFWCRLWLRLLRRLRLLHKRLQRRLRCRGLRRRNRRRRRTRGRGWGGTRSRRRRGSRSG